MKITSPCGELVDGITLQPGDMVKFVLLDEPVDDDEEAAYGQPQAAQLPAEGTAELTYLHTLARDIFLRKTQFFFFIAPMSWKWFSVGGIWFRS